MLESTGVSNEQISSFEEHYDDVAGSRTEFTAANVVNARSFEVKTKDVVIKVAPDRTDLIETKEVDGKLCLVIEISDQVEVNGITVKPL